MDRLTELLQRGRNGNAVLFCGAGITADCLNFDDTATLGISSHLLGLFNDELTAHGKESGFKDLRIAASRFKRDLGSHRLMQLLKERFRMNKVSASIVDIVRYPWSTIYTTNYDNGLELALQRAGKKFVAVNNLDHPSGERSGTPIIHLHGFAEAWSDSTFEQSCVLDSDSYRRLSGVQAWFKKLRLEFERAEVVVFIGFSVSDFHLEQVLFNASGLKEKAFFINRPTAAPDPDARAVQEDFGLPLYFGRETFAQIVIEIMDQLAPREPSLASFSRFLPTDPSPSVPPVQDIEDLFIWGKVVAQHIKRDCDLLESDYHVVRHEVQEIQESMEETGRIGLLFGDICDGKSLTILGAMNALVVSRPVFELRHPYDDLLEETASILSVYPNAVLVVENCFTIRDDRLLGLARQVAGSDGGLILSARSISTEAETGKFGSLRAMPSFRKWEIGKLTLTEIDALIALIDQIAGWRNFQALSHSDRQRFVERECRSVIPSVLLHLLDSEYVREKYKEEYQKTSYLDARDGRMMIAALLVSNIGFDPPISFFSDIFEKDFVSVLQMISRQPGELRLVRVADGVVRTVPSIGARNLLRNVIDDREIVNTTIEVLEKMATDIARSDLQQHIFSQLMRYSILSSVVTEESEINRFFDHISKIRYFRSMPLFWLQWHMAMCAQARWLEAEKYLEMGYTAAEAYEKRRGLRYNRKQLDDRRAKFLAARAIAMQKAGAELFRDLKEALDIADRLLRESELTHHPFETLLDIVRVLQMRSNTIDFNLRDILEKQSQGVILNARRRIDVVAEGYQRGHAESAVAQMEVIRP
jgi:hypothetical protein